MVLNRLSAVGLGIVAAMHLLFVLTGLARPTVGLAYSVLGLIGALAAAWGLWALPRRAAVGALAAGLALLLAARAPPFLRDVPPFGIDDLGGALSVSGFLLALASAALWALQPDAQPQARAQGIRAGLWLAAAGYTVTMMLVVSVGSLSLLLGLMLGAVGFSLAAPNVHHEAAGAESPAAVAARDPPTGTLR